MKYAVKHEYTDEELIQRVTDVMEIRNVMGRHAYYHAKNMHQKELKEIWVQKPETRQPPPLDRTGATTWVWNALTPITARAVWKTTRRIWRS